jgi:LexA DNA binding domain
MGSQHAAMMDIANGLSGKVVSHVEQRDPGSLEIHFMDGSVLGIAMLAGHVTASLTGGRSNSKADTRHDDPSQPTTRQQDYLEFIARYMARYGVSPAESDIARHFMVSPPSANQMVRTLEHRGFITRQAGVPRSITIVGRSPAQRREERP